VIDAANVSDLAWETSVVWLGFATNETALSMNNARWMAGVPGIRGNDAAAHNFTEENVTGLVSDTRIDRDHPELTSSLLHVHPENPSEEYPKAKPTATGPRSSARSSPTATETTRSRG